jgi:hypothetical protein
MFRFIVAHVDRPATNRMRDDRQDLFDFVSEFIVVGVWFGHAWLRLT